MGMLALPWLLLATGAAPAAEALTDVDRASLHGLVQKLMTLASVDLGNCQHEYDDFDAGYIALLDRGESERLKRLVDTHDIEVKAPENVEHNPTHAQCMDVLDAASRTYAENAAFIARLSDATLAPESSEAP